ncbi:hypothetical protein PUMCH_000585 [Australozyma saopauloensis]|uniref:Uncharacterized protein n=1 Tax=Australozyma saopauloensis TaxID=291208 RepID=A0AAX4H4I1_9ASCO|nr:hypothetical protein PUMCH_000585 [[Candida] saopauloensis]
MPLYLRSNHSHSRGGWHKRDGKYHKIPLQESVFNVRPSSSSRPDTADSAKTYHGWGSFFGYFSNGKSTRQIQFDSSQLCAHEKLALLQRPLIQGSISTHEEFNMCRYLANRTNFSKSGRFYFPWSINVTLGVNSPTCESIFDTEKMRQALQITSDPDFSAIYLLRMLVEKEGDIPMLVLQVDRMLENEIFMALATFVAHNEQSFGAESSIALETVSQNNASSSSIPIVGLALLHVGDASIQRVYLGGLPKNNDNDTHRILEDIMKAVNFERSDLFQLGIKSAAFLDIEENTSLK